MKKIAASLFFGIFCLAGADVAHAADADGKTLYTQKLCNTCHGPDAKTPIAPNYPKLAGQNAVYASQQVKDIKSGKRNNGLTAVMKGLVANVTDAEIDAITKYLETLK